MYTVRFTNAMKLIIVFVLLYIWTLFETMLRNDNAQKPKCNKLSTNEL